MEIEEGHTRKEHQITFRIRGGEEVAEPGTDNPSIIRPASMRIEYTWWTHDHGTGQTVRVSVTGKCRSGDARKTATIHFSDYRLSKGQVPAWIVGTVEGYAPDWFSLKEVGL